MSQVNNLLTERTAKASKKQSGHSKMAEMARQSALGHLTSFSGVFSIAELSSKEKGDLETLLTTYSTEGNVRIEEDLNLLISLTSEVKAINNQAALLHGERIKKAHQILTRYRDGAFTEWLKATYGNRQTPYNFLQYFEFYHALAEPLRLTLEEMPRQAVYTLASRKCPLEKKKEIVEGYRGETKAALLEMIRQMFPLENSDNRKENLVIKTLKEIKKILSWMKHPEAKFSREQKHELLLLLDQMEKTLSDH